MIVRDELSGHKGTGADYNAVLGDALFHVNDAAVCFGEVVHQNGVGLGGDDGQHIAVCLHRGDLQVVCSAFMHLNQMFKAGFDCGSIALPAVGEADVVLQGDLPCAVIHQLIALRQPGLESTVVRDFQQRLADAVADAGPAGVGLMGIDGRFFVRCIESVVAEYEGFLRRRRRTGNGIAVPAGGGRCTGAAAAAGQDADGEAEYQKDCKDLFHVCLFPFFVLSKKLCETGAYRFRFSVRGSSSGPYNRARCRPEG